MSRGLDLSDQINTRLLLRFMSKVQVSDGCWEWKRSRGNKGYGDFGMGGKTHYGAHIVSYALFNGPVPAGLFVCHHCDNRPCVRPGHLFLGTALDNARDCVQKGRHVAAKGWPGGRPPHTHLTEEIVRELRSRPRTSINVTQTAREFGVSARAIRMVLNGETWTSVVQHPTKEEEGDREMKALHA